MHISRRNKTESEASNLFQDQNAQHLVCFLLDNVCPHIAVLKMEMFQKLKQDFLPHSNIYSADLETPDFNVFGPIKELLGRKKFNTNEEVINAVVNMQSQDFYFLELRNFLSTVTCVLQQQETYYIEKYHVNQ